MKNREMFAVLILILLTAGIAGSAQAMGSRGTVSPLGQCYTNADNACKPACGDPWNPNPKGWTLPDGTFYPNVNYKANVATFSQSCLDACHAPTYAVCTAKFK